MEWFEKIDNELFEQSTEIFRRMGLPPMDHIEFCVDVVDMMDNGVPLLSAVIREMRLIMLAHEQKILDRICEKNGAEKMEASESDYYSGDLEIYTNIA